MKENPTSSLPCRLLTVFCGGFCGTLTRYFVSLFVQSHLGKSWPYDILLINITGALLLSFITTLADETLLIGPKRRLFLNVGFLGAYTTFSSLVLGTDQLFLKGSLLPALLYMFLSLVGGLCAVLFGDWQAQLLLARLLPAIRRKKSISLPVLHSGFSAEGPEHVDIQDDVVSSEGL